MTKQHVNGLGTSRREFLFASAIVVVCGCGGDEGDEVARNDDVGGGDVNDTPAEAVDIQAIRESNLEKLEAMGFRVADSLPVWNDAFVVRPTEEVARRLMAIDAVFTWVSATEEIVEAQPIRDYAKRNGLRDAMTPDERAQFEAPRETANENSGTAGWRLENMWALAWVLGFDPEPGVTDGMIPQEVSDAIQGEFLPRLDETTNDFLSRIERRSNKSVVELHDLYFCAHNAVRSAQLGRDTVPDGFHPVVDGGTVHERRHSLTWCLSPGVAWDDTELST